MSVIEITKPKIQIDPGLLSQLVTKTEEMGQVVLHFLFNVPIYSEGTKIRIWPSSYLYDLNSDHVSELVHHENITLYPEWQDIEAGGQRFFSLFFSGLPKSCTLFDFVEECNAQYGAFEVRNIQRNNSDVYYFLMR